MRSLMGIVASYVYRALFLYGLSDLRMGSTLLIAIHVVLAVLVTYRSGALGLLPLTAALIAIYALCGMTKLVLYSSLLASVPGFWMALTTAVLYHFEPRLALRYIEVFARYTMLSLNALYVVHAANVSELAVMLSRIGREAGLYPLLVFRMGVLLREVGEMSEVHRLKGVPVSRTLAMALVRSEEVAELMEEGLFAKRGRFRPRALYSRRGLALQAILVAIDCATLLSPLPHL